MSLSVKSPFFAKFQCSRPAGSINPNNTGFTYGQLAQVNAEKLMGIAGQYAAEGNQTVDNLAHLRKDQIVGQWRDSTYGQCIQGLSYMFSLCKNYATKRLEHGIPCRPDRISAASSLCSPRPPEGRALLCMMYPIRACRESPCRTPSENYHCLGAPPYLVSMQSQSS